jgi:hypothetical protein
MQTSVGAGDVGFPGPVGDLGGGQGERIGVALALGEGAEPAPGVADVGEVDVAVDHVGHVVADHIAAQRVGQRSHRRQRGPVGAGQGEVLVIRAPGGVFFRRAQRGQHVGVDALGGAGGELGDLVADGLPVPERRVQIRAGIGQPALGVDGGVQIDPAQRLGGLIGFLPGQAHRVHRPGPPGVRVGQCVDVRAHPRVDPRRAGLDIARLGGQSGHQVIAGFGGHRGEVIEGRPGPLGVDVIRGQRRHPTPVVDPGADQRQALGA